jgi:DNA-binding CsgD family transcriptional regulator
MRPTGDQVAAHDQPAELLAGYLPLGQRFVGRWEVGGIRSALGVQTEGHRSRGQERGFDKVTTRKMQHETWRSTFAAVCRENLAFFLKETPFSIRTIYRTTNTGMKDSPERADEDARLRGGLESRPKQTRAAGVLVSPSGLVAVSECGWARVAWSLKLSPRELQIARGVLDDATESAIAADLAISKDTVHSYLRRLFAKLAVKSRGRLMLRIVGELVALTLSEKAALPPLCPHRAAGRCGWRDLNRRKNHRQAGRRTLASPDQATPG